MEFGASARERVGTLMREVGKETVLRYFRALARADVREKGPNDFVTVADVECERLLAARLLAAYPGTAVLGEEAAAADPGLMGRLREAKPLWVLDPIDGTINFAHGRPGFAVIVALVIGGRTEAGWIHDPLADETVTALRGGGAWSEGEQVFAAKGVELSRMTGSAYGPGAGTILADKALAESGRVGQIANRLCGGVEYIDFAKARRHFMLSSRSLPWDHAAGVLIAREAGGIARFLDGSDYAPTVSEKRVLVATDEASWRHLQALLQA
ncbi:MAG TPA: inositol monophosphatase family protein [Alphaproteobacteria bacterium]|nr:inositol monophosphatase family protein [Alphaproteobacteria bacterium]